jgi:hypothetical protein
MAKKWAEVESSAEYQALAPDAREQARQQYFEQVITPQVPAEHVEEARAQFDAQTGPKKEQPVEELPASGSRAGFIAKNAARGAAGIAETAAEFATGALATPLAGLAGIGAAAADTGALVANKVLPDSMQLPGVDAAEVVRSVQDKLTYHPQAELSQKMSAVVNSPTAWLADKADRAGEWAADKTGSPMVGTVVNTAINAVPMAIDPAMRGMAKPSKLTKPTPEPKQRSATGTMTEEQARSANVETLLANNIPVPEARRGTSLISKQKESWSRAADTVFGPSSMLDKQGQAFTNAVLGKLEAARGNPNFKNITRATPEVMQEIRQNISNTYDDLLSRNPTWADPQMMQELTDARVRALREEAPAVAAQIDAIIAKQQPNNPNGPLVIDGREAQSSRAALGRLQQSQNTSVKHWAGEVKEILDDAFERTASPEDAAAMRQVRADVQKLDKIEPAIGENGIISPGRLYQKLSEKRNARQMKYGQGDQSLVQLAKAAKDVLPEKLGNSGTPARHADIMKVVHGITNPLRAATEGAAIGIGRLANNAGANAGTLSDVRGRNYRLQAPPQGPNTGLATAAGAVTSSSQSQEERRRRLQADALRKER